MWKNFLRGAFGVDRFVLFSVVLFGLIGCGGGGGGAEALLVQPPATSSQPPAPAPLPAPTISSQPANETVVAGASASFSVGASGGMPITYQWQRNGADIAGAGSSTYTVSAAFLPDDGATFTAKVSSAAGVLISSGATLSVQPVGTMSLVAGTVTFTTSTVQVPASALFADGPAASARFRLITGLVVDRAGNLFVTDTFNHVVRKISVAGQVSTFAGMPGVYQQGNAGFQFPAGLAIDSTDTLYVIDNFPLIFGIRWYEVKAISSQGVISTLWQDLISPASLAVDAARNVYVPFVRISPAGVVNKVDICAAPQAGGFYGLAMGADGTYYFAKGNTIWKNPPGSGLQVLAGTTERGTADGPAQQARFTFTDFNSIPAMQFQLPMVVDSAGNLYFSDDKNIRRVSKDGFVTTLTGRPGTLAGVGVGDLADLPISSGALALRGDKTLYFSYNSAVFKLERR